MIRCHHCGENCEDKPDRVFSAGDFDPFCNRACEQAHSAGLSRMMDEISSPGTNLAVWLGVPALHEYGHMPR